MGFNNFKGGYGAVFNASNEVAVRAFLNDEIPFLMIEEIIDKCMNEYRNEKIENYEKLAEIDAKTRQKADKLIKEGRNK